MPRGKKATEAAGTPEAPLYVRDAPVENAAPSPTAAPATPVTVRPVPDEEETLPAPLKEGKSSDASFDEALAELHTLPEQKQPERSEEPLPTPPAISTTTPHAEADPAEKPEHAKPDDVVRMRADLSATKRNEQEQARLLKERDSDIASLQDEIEELAKIATEAGQDEAVAAARTKHSSGRAQRQATSQVDTLYAQTYSLLESAGFEKEADGVMFKPHPVVSHIQQAFKADPQEGRRLAFIYATQTGAWNREAASNGHSETARADPKAESASKQKLYTEEEVVAREKVAAQHAKDTVRGSALEAAATATFPSGAVGHDINKEFWSAEPEDKFDLALSELSKKGR